MKFSCGKADEFIDVSQRGEQRAQNPTAILTHFHRIQGTVGWGRRLGVHRHSPSPIPLPPFLCHGPYPQKWLPMVGLLR